MSVLLVTAASYLQRQPALVDGGQQQRQHRLQAREAGRWLLRPLLRDGVRR